MWVRKSKRRRPSSRRCGEGLGADSLWWGLVLVGAPQRLRTGSPSQLDEAAKQLRVEVAELDCSLARVRVLLLLGDDFLLEALTKRAKRQ